MHVPGPDEGKGKVRSTSFLRMHGTSYKFLHMKPPWKKTEILSCRMFKKCILRSNKFLLMLLFNFCGNSVSLKDSVILTASNLREGELVKFFTFSYLSMVQKKLFYIQIFEIDLLVDLCILVCVSVSLCLCVRA